MKTIVVTIFSVLLGLSGCSDAQISEEVLVRAYGEKKEPSKNNLKVLYIGHSLVGRVIPHMVRQLAGEGHEYAGQLGWGTKLQRHWDLETEIKGFEFVTTFTDFENAKDAIKSGVFDAFVLTEGVEIKDAIKYHESDQYLTKFVRLIHEHNPDAKIYFYETWHEITDPEGWLFRIQRDYEKYWLGEILDKTLITTKGEIPIYIIPAGQVMKAFFENIGELQGEITSDNYAALFNINDGKQDTIHLNSLGSYLVALVHYSVMYQSPSLGKPHELLLKNGEPAKAPDKKLAEYMQKVSWEVVSKNPRTGITPYASKKPKQ